MLEHSTVSGRQRVIEAVMWKYKGQRHGRRACASVKWDYILDQVNGVKSISHLTGERLDI